MYHGTASRHLSKKPDWHGGAFFELLPNYCDLCHKVKIVFYLRGCSAFGSMGLRVQLQLTPKVESLQ